MKIAQEMPDLYWKTRQCHFYGSQCSYCKTPVESRTGSVNKKSYVSCCRPLTNISEYSMYLLQGAFQ